jgi:hypothetical protein
MRRLENILATRTTRPQQPPTDFPFLIPVPLGCNARLTVCGMHSGILWTAWSCLFTPSLNLSSRAFEGEQSVQPKLSDESLSRLENEDLRWRARLFAHWRLWSKHAIEKDYRLGLLPADTRIPDHSIWNHMQVVSALAGCIGQDKVWCPAFLKFQLGPVQEFIAAARSTRDLWSGSYVLSWLMAAGLKALS